ncbi:MAG: ATP-binding protein, partial [Cyanobacteria bacterium P01_H01_bin.121]
MLNLLQQWLSICKRWWFGFPLQTKLLVVATLAVSLTMSSLTFWAVESIQQDARLNDTRFGRDLGVLLAANVTPLVAEQNYEEVARFSHKFYAGTSSIRYMLYADADGQIILGIPFSGLAVQDSLRIQRRIQLPENYASDSKTPMVRQHQTPYGEVADIFMPLNQDGQYLGVLALGINPNPTAMTASRLTRDVTIAVFISIWVMVILGVVINALTITRPIKELVLGVKSIAVGNFQQRVELPFGGELGELIDNFNEMAERLERYEAHNIEELTAEKAKLETLVATIADGAILLNTDMHVVLANATARRIFSWDADAISGQDVLSHLPLEVCNELRSPLYALVEEGGGTRDERVSQGNEYRVTLTEPTKRTIRMMLTTVFDQARANIKGIAITIQDITREVELNEAKSQFISNVSHELRTPLFNIKSFIETLHDYGSELNVEEQREFLATANHETDRLTRLVNDVLDLSRLESSHAYNFGAVDLAQAIEQTLRTYQLNARDQQIELLSALEPKLPTVRGNYDLLLQVLANLVGNSLKFTNSQGQIKIYAYTLDLTTSELNSELSNGAKVRIEIADTGIGIDTADQAAIFERFFRVENRVHTLEGTGLGLSIVRNIIDRHQSQVQLVSEVGVGTTFWFDLDVLQLPTRESNGRQSESDQPELGVPEQAGSASLDQAHSDDAAMLDEAIAPPTVVASGRQ